MSTPIITQTVKTAGNIRLFTTDHPDIPVPNKERIQYGHLKGYSHIVYPGGQHQVSFG